MKFNCKIFFKGLAFGIIFFFFVIKGLGGVSYVQEESDGSFNIIIVKKYCWKMVIIWLFKFLILGEVCEVFVDCV